jgi:hypothetical protein
VRQYTVVFMEQVIGVPRLTPLDGDAGIATFAAADDESAVAHIAAHFIDRLKASVRAELSSMHLESDPSVSEGTRLVDDSHSNPHFQDTYVKYNPATKSVDVDFDATRTALFVDLPPSSFAFKARG